MKLFLFGTFLRSIARQRYEGLQLQDTEKYFIKLSLESGVIRSASMAMIAVYLSLHGNNQPCLCHGQDLCNQLSDDRPSCAVDEICMSAIEVLETVILL
ncbi:hypothetical protein S83_008422, partial [Arachis hypogaea]